MPTSGGADRAGARIGSRGPGAVKYALRQHHSGERGSSLSRRSPAGAPPEELDSLERDGDGAPTKQKGPRNRRSYLDLFLAGDAARGRVQSLLSRPLWTSTGRLHLFSGSCLTGRVRARLPAGTNHPGARGKLPP